MAWLLKDGNRMWFHPIDTPGGLADGWIHEGPAPEPVKAPEEDPSRRLTDPQPGAGSIAGAAEAPIAGGETGDEAPAVDYEAELAASLSGEEMIGEAHGEAGEAHGEAGDASAASETVEEDHGVVSNEAGDGQTVAAAIGQNPKVGKKGRK